LKIESREIECARRSRLSDGVQSAAREIEL
jgi:hypothetical protein